jgi:hypothetical protein
MHRIGIGGGMHRDRLDPHFRQARITRSAISPRLAIRILSNMAGPHSMIIRGAPYSTGVPSSTRMRLTVPARGAGMWFIVFIASMISTVWPSVDLGADRDEGRGAGFGRQIGGADHGRGHGARVLAGIFWQRRRGGGGRCAGRHAGGGLWGIGRRGRGGDHRRLLDHAHLQAVILAIFALYRDFGQLVLVQSSASAEMKATSASGECLLMPSSVGVSVARSARPSALSCLLAGRALSLPAYRTKRAG